MKNVILVIWLTGFLQISFCQDTIKTQVDFFVTDHLNNIYIVHNNILHKYNFEKILEYSFSSSQLGEITYVDASDPFRVLVYDKEYNQLFFLNNQLASLRNPIQLSDLGIEFSEIASSSNQNGFWVFDRLESQLKFFDIQNTLKFTSQRLDQLFNLETSPITLLERNNYVFINFCDYGILIFDSFGNFFKKIPIKNTGLFNVSGNIIYYYKENKIEQLNYITLQKNIIKEFANKNIANAYLNNNFIYIQIPEGIKKIKN